MSDEMITIPGRVNEIEQKVHTLEHRVHALEDAHKDTPVRMAKLESSIGRLPEIERKLEDQGEQIRKGFNTVRGMLLGAAVVWGALQVGPQFLRLMGAS